MGRYPGTPGLVALPPDWPTAEDIRATIGGALLAGTILGVGAMAAKAISTRHVINEYWTDKPALPDYERQGRFRKYVKDWGKRHKKGIRAIGAVGLLGAAVALASQAANSKK